jgi:DNA-binding LacI/PurR family transcriptional regulator
VQLVEQFQVSGVTIQRALDRLVREGFICTRGRHGTFVTANPPHLCNYGLVFVDQPRRGEHRSRYHEMLESQAFRLQRDGDRRVTVFDGISGREDEESSRQLLADVRAHRMAGLMLVDPDPLEGTAIMEEPGIGRVAIMSRKVELPECPIVYPDMAGMIDLGLDTLVAQGCRRIAVVASVPVYFDSGAYLRAAIRQRPIQVEERWIQIAAHELPDAVRNMVLLMMHPSAGERPDGIFVVDDNLAEGTSRGLVDTGVRVPQDVKVVAHCNFPWPTPSALPIRRLGYDARQILGICVGILDRLREGKKVPPETLVDAIFEDETTPAATTAGW